MYSHDLESNCGAVVVAGLPFDSTETTLSVIAFKKVIEECILDTLNEDGVKTGFLMATTIQTQSKAARALKKLGFIGSSPITNPSGNKTKIWYLPLSKWKYSKGD